MSCITDLKALWQRFVQWERFVLLREKEWRFPINGTVEDFEQRFNILVPPSPRNEFFGIKERRKNIRLSGFYESGEVAIKSPNPRPAGKTKPSRGREFSLYHFHGSLNQNQGNLYLYGHNRLTQQTAKGALRAINSWLIYGGTLLIIALAARGVEILTGAALAHFISSFLIFWLPLILPIFALGAVINCLFGRFSEYYDRRARAETYRLLAEICSSAPPQETAE
jgi:hypothetical protein